MICPGSYDIQSLYRSKLVGLAGIMTFVQHLWDKEIISPTTTDAAYDGKATLQHVFCYTNSHVKTSQEQFDVIAYCRELILISPVKRNHRHACSHKDDWADTLDEYEQMNVEMGALA